MEETKSDIEFTIYGPAHTEEYWKECKQELRKLPSNVKWEWKGNLDSESVVETLKHYHVFLFPTLGENFGHVIQEALSAGCPCIISDQTPWRDFESQGVGYVFSLENKSAFVNAVEKYAVMKQEEFQNAVEKAHQYAIDNIKLANLKNVFNALAALFILNRYLCKIVCSNKIMKEPEIKSNLFTMVGWDICILEGNGFVRRLSTNGNMSVLVES